MKALCLSGAALAASIALAPAGALAQPVTVGGVLSPPIPGPGNGSLFPTPIPPQTGVRGAHDGHRRDGHGFNNGVFFYEEPYTVHDVVVVHDEYAPPPEPLPPPPAPREPYVLGHSYGSLPGGCMKMISGGASYFQCSGEWYRQVGSEYEAVKMP